MAGCTQVANSLHNTIIDKSEQNNSTINGNSELKISKPPCAARHGCSRRMSVGHIVILAVFLITDLQVKQHCIN